MQGTLVPMIRTYNNARPGAEKHVILQGPRTAIPNVTPLRETATPYGMFCSEEELHLARHADLNSSLRLFSTYTIFMASSHLLSWPLSPDWPGKTMTSAL